MSDEKKATAEGGAVTAACPRCDEMAAELARLRRTVAAIPRLIRDMGWHKWTNKEGVERRCQAAGTWAYNRAADRVARFIMNEDTPTHD